jgi:hypothetical protein
MLGRPGHPVFTRFAAAAEAPPPKPDRTEAAEIDSARKAALMARDAA